VSRADVDNGPDRVFILEAMRQLQHAAHREVEERLARAGYPDVRTPHINLLAYVPRGEGVRMSVLAARMELTRGAITQLVAHLEGLGLVERIADPDDGRGVIVRPTLAADRGYEVARRALAEIEARWEAEVGSRTWTLITDALERLATRENVRPRDDPRAAPIVR
jgi:DNA-binding MarR family transcriptional regulator